MGEETPNKINLESFFGGGGQESFTDPISQEALGLANQGVSVANENRLNLNNLISTLSIDFGKTSINIKNEYVQNTIFQLESGLKALENSVDILHGDVDSVSTTLIGLREQKKREVEAAEQSVFAQQDALQKARKEGGGVNPEDKLIPGSTTTKGKSPEDKGNFMGNLMGAIGTAITAPLGLLVGGKLLAPKTTQKIIGQVGKALNKVPGVKQVKNLGAKISGGFKSSVQTITGKGAGKKIATEGLETGVKTGAKGLFGGGGKEIVKEGGEQLLETGAKKGLFKGLFGGGGKKIATEGGEQLLKKGLSTGAKVGVGKGLGKGLLKKIPGIGLLMGTGFAAHRLMQGDVTGAGLELASGAASTVPGWGTGLSFGIDAGLIARDVTRDGSGKVDDKGKPSGIESKSISTSEKATLKDGQVVSGNMSQEDAEKAQQRLDLEKNLRIQRSIHGRNSPEANEIQKKLMVLKGTPEEAIYTDKKGNLRTKGYSTFEGKTTVDGDKKKKGWFSNLFSGKDKPRKDKLKGSSSGILGTISSDPKDMVNMPEGKTIGEGAKIDTGKFLNMSTPREESNFGGMGKSDKSQTTTSTDKEQSLEEKARLRGILYPNATIVIGGKTVKAGTIEYEQAMETTGQALKGSQVDASKPFVPTVGNKDFVDQISQPPSKNKNVVELPPVNLPPEGDITDDDNLNDAPNANNGEISSEDGGIPFINLVEGNANTNMNLFDF